MLVYRDMTFCNNPGCKKEDCFRRLTDKVIKAAADIEIPLSVATFDCIDREDNNEQS